VGFLGDMINTEYIAEFNAEMVDIDSVMNYTEYSSRYTLYRALKNQTNGVGYTKNQLSPRNGRTTRYWVSKSALKQWAHERNLYSLVKALSGVKKPVVVEDHKAIAASYKKLYVETVKCSESLAIKLNELRLRNWFQRLFNISSTK
jgi:hypothetical protein